MTNRVLHIPRAYSGTCPAGSVHVHMHRFKQGLRIVQGRHSCASRNPEDTGVRFRTHHHSVIPAQAGTQETPGFAPGHTTIPSFLRKQEPRRHHGFASGCATIPSFLRKQEPRRHDGIRFTFLACARGTVGRVPPQAPAPAVFQCSLLGPCFRRGDVLGRRFEPCVGHATPPSFLRKQEPRRQHGFASGCAVIPSFLRKQEPRRYDGIRFTFLACARGMVGRVPPQAPAPAVFQRSLLGPCFRRGDVLGRRFEPCVGHATPPSFLRKQEPRRHDGIRFTFLACARGTVGRVPPQAPAPAVFQCSLLGPCFRACRFKSLVAPD